jgi:hypothetical protein
MYLNPVSKDVLITADNVPVIIINDIVKKKIILYAFHLVIFLFSPYYIYCFSPVYFIIKLIITDILF